MSVGERIVQLEKLQETNKKQPPETYKIPWRKSTLVLDVIEVPVDFLRYRIDNGRTKIAQQKYLQERSYVPADFFKDPEDDAVQEAQHAILKAMIDRKELRMSLKDDKQAEPGIVTHDGFMINGNRRLCALREDKVRYMDVVVLPPCDRSELYHLELALQMAPNTKDDYTWIDQLLHVRAGREDYRQTVSQIAKGMRLKERRERHRKLTPEQQVEEMSKLLALIDQYLDYFNVSGQYHLVWSESKTVFEELLPRLESPQARNLTPEQRQYYLEYAYYRIQQAPREISGSPYESLRKDWSRFLKNTEEFMASNHIRMGVPPVVTTELDATALIEAGSEQESEIEAPALPSGDAATAALSTTTEDGQQHTPKNPFEALAELPSDDSLSGDELDVSSVLDRLRSLKETPHLVVEAAKATVEDLDAKQAAKRPVEVLRKAEKALQSIDIETAASAPPTDGFDPQEVHELLEKIQVRVDELRMRLRTVESGDQ